MTYVEFLVGCRQLIARRQNKTDLTRAEFAAACSDRKKYTVAYLRNIEEGYQPPGRELLEAACRAAGFEFERCLVLPEKIQIPTRRQLALESFTDALNDWRELDAIEAASALSMLQRQRRPKFGGRTRKK